MTDERRMQVAAQCDAVCHLAKALAEVHNDYAEMFRKGHAEVLIDQVGERTARIMETLGDILNGMDAVSEEDERLNPIFEEAQRLWPQKSEAA